MMKTPIVLDAAAVAQLLPQVDVLQEMRALFADLGLGQAVQPAQTLTLFPEGQGDFITYLGAAAGQAPLAPSCRLICRARAGRLSPPGPC